MDLKGRPSIPSNPEPLTPRLSKSTRRRMCQTRHPKHCHALPNRPTFPSTCQPTSRTLGNAADIPGLHSSLQIRICCCGRGGTDRAGKSLVNSTGLRSRSASSSMPRYLVSKCTIHTERLLLGGSEGGRKASAKSSDTTARDCALCDMQRGQRVAVASLSQDWRGHALELAEGALLGRRVSHPVGAARLICLSRALDLFFRRFCFSFKIPRRMGTAARKTNARDHPELPHSRTRVGWDAGGGKAGRGPGGTKSRHV